MSQSSSVSYVTSGHISASDSELSELSDTDEPSTDDTGTIQPSLKIKIQPQAPIEVTVKDGDGISGCEVDRNNTLKNDNSDERPAKRLRMDGRGHSTSASAATHAATNTPRDTNEQSNVLSHRLLPDTSMQLLPALGDCSSKKHPVPALSSLTSEDNITSESAEVIQQMKRSLVMSILPKTELDTLKSHNNVLRSHNVSLARRNTALLADNAIAATLYEEIKDLKPMSHNGCIKAEEVDQILSKHRALEAEMAGLQREHQLMQECGFEWARREIQWETEQKLLKNEVNDLVGRVNELASREQRMLVEAQQLTTRAQQAEHRAQVAEHTVEQERRRAVAMREYVNRAQAAVQAAIQSRDSASNRSAYPEF